MTRVYLTLADVLGMHAIILARYGGAQGVRDRAAVEAALARPRCGWYAGTVEEACALCESLLMNHPFIDGNKRTAFAALDVFLRLNGIRLEVADGEMHRLILRWIAVPAAERQPLMVQDVQPLAGDGRGLRPAQREEGFPG